MIIAIDGHSSCGKSTLAKAIAKKFNFTYIDSGAMYRVITLYAIQNNLLSDFNELEKAFSANKIHIDFQNDSESGKYNTFMNKVNVENEIRGMEVAKNVSRVAELSFVRKSLVDLQRKLSENRNVVMDGRDIGTVVFPNADLKIFLTAKPEIRAERRYKELSEKNEIVNFDEILANVLERDYIDSNRTDSPLKKADDAIEIDNSSLTLEQQNLKAFELISKKL